jgi:sec-independent protein translocase protein TatA
MFRNPTTDLIVVLVIVLLIFGPKRLPTLGRQLGHGLREFKDSITGEKGSEDEKRPEITAANSEPTASETAVHGQAPTETQAGATAAPSAPTPEVGSPERRS